MASATATTKAEAGLRAFLRSRIARIIFLWNFAGLAILLVGVLLLTEIRAGLTEAEARNLRAQGELIANLLIETATVQGDPNPGLNEPAVREVLRRLLPAVAESPRPGVGGKRVRVFAPDGQVVADTDVLQARLDETALPGVGASADFGQTLGRAARGMEYLRLTPWRATSTLEAERRGASRGAIAQGERVNETGARVVSVTLPIRRVHAVLGVVTVESANVERILLAERAGMIPFMLGAALAVFASSLLLTLFIARPLKRLAEAADKVRLSGAARLRLPEVSRRTDEIGALSLSLEAMTDALADRIDVNQRFAADVSHEIKNPLASIRSAVETARAIKDQERQTQLLAIVAQDVMRLDRLITDIASASRIEAETARGDLAQVDLAALLRHLVSAYASAPDEQARAAVIFRDPAPEIALGGAIVLGQEGPLGQVFRNLIDNARSFSPEGGIVRVGVEIVRARDGAFVRAIVEDGGPGIPPENLETVFQRFYTERPKGVAFGANSGLGLSIARQIVIAHKGRIYAQNIEGQGARLVVELPLAGDRKG